RSRRENATSAGTHAREHSRKSHRPPGLGEESGERSRDDAPPRLIRDAARTPTVLRREKLPLRVLNSARARARDSFVPSVSPPPDAAEEQRSAGVPPPGAPPGAVPARSRVSAVIPLSLALLLMLLAGPSEEFFFEYPKKALMEFFQSLRAKKQTPKTDMQHYHIHYYPMPVQLLAWKAPGKRDLDKLYSDAIRSLGWADYPYKFTPDPMMILSGFQQLLDDSSTWDQDFLGTEIEDQMSIDRNMKGILVPVPINPQLVMQWLKKSRKEAAT
ncbi:PREDICTED: uncharacterized protein LOC106742244, partial [Dinoponera quadriceps]|uniref:Uncharacterized protein LOC106742244 n=1 Tax=Dinoponera quadriceps TaxID=609295 RepID=A0A6P3WXW7_DINQU